MKPLDHLGLSLWAATANPPPATRPLEGERKADVVIVGAGYTGLSCAVHLADAGRETVVLEARGIGHGGSGRNLGQVNPGVWADPQTVEKHLGEARGSRFNEAFGRSFELVESLVNRFEIACGLTRSGNVYVAHSARAVRAVEERYRQLRACGFDVEFLDRPRTAALIGNDCYHAALLDKRAGNIHPLNYALGLADGAISLGAALHTASPVRRLAPTGDGWRAETDAGSVSAKRAVIATDSYSGELWPGLARTMVPIGVYAAATEPLGENLRKSFLPQRTSTFETALVPTYARMLASGRCVVGTLGYPPLWKEGPFDRWPRRQLGRLFPAATGRALRVQVGRHHRHVRRPPAAPARAGARPHHLLRLQRPRRHLRDPGRQDHRRAHRWPHEGRGLPAAGAADTPPSLPALESRGPGDRLPGLPGAFLASLKRQDEDAMPCTASAGASRPIDAARREGDDCRAPLGARIARTGEGEPVSSFPAIARRRVLSCINAKATCGRRSEASR